MGEDDLRIEACDKLGKMPERLRRGRGFGNALVEEPEDWFAEGRFGIAGTQLLRPKKGLLEEGSETYATDAFYTTSVFYCRRSSRAGVRRTVFMMREV